MMKFTARKEDESWVVQSANGRVLRRFMYDRDDSMQHKLAAIQASAYLDGLRDGVDEVRSLATCSVQFG